MYEFFMKIITFLAHFEEKMFHRGRLDVPILLKLCLLKGMKEHP